MSNVQNPTYFLAPNWNFHPGGRIAIGNIIVNPLKPHLPLTKASPDNAPTTTTSREKNWSLSVETALNLSASVWAVFLENIRVSVAANRERIKSAKFTMSALETTYLSEDPSPEEIKTRCNDPSVTDFMRLDSVLCKPVYMVTGIKVAKDFKLEGETSKTKGFEAETSGQVTAEASLGVSGGVSKTKRIADEFEAEGDIIFAYQLIKIKPKGWSKEKTFEISEFQHHQAFLGDDKSKDEEEVEGEPEAITAEDLGDLKKAQVVGVNGAAVAFEAPKATS